MTDSVGLLPWAVGGVLIVTGASRVWPRYRAVFGLVDVAILGAAALVPGPRPWVRIALGVLALATAALVVRNWKVLGRTPTSTR